MYSIPTHTRNVLRLEYAEVMYKEDDMFNTYISPLYNIVAVSSEYEKKISLPTLYFIPKQIPLPPILSNKFMRCVYEDENNHPGSEIEKWLERNSEHSMRLDKFVCVVNKKNVEQTTSDDIPVMEFGDKDKEDDTIFTKLLDKLKF